MEKKTKKYLIIMVVCVVIALTAWAFWPGMGRFILSGLGATFAGVGAIFTRRPNTNSRSFQERNTLSNNIKRNQQELENENIQSRERIDRVRIELAEAESIIGRSEIELDSVTSILGRDIEAAKARHRIVGGGD